MAPQPGRVNVGEVGTRRADQAEQRLSLDYQQAANFQHSGVRGDERADALTEFLRAHLPGVFGVGMGEARDLRDNVTGQLDVFVYDQLTAAPITAVIT